MSRKELYAIAEEFLVEQGFDFGHRSWHLDSRVHEIPKCVDCDSPGIAFFHNDDSFISISSVVNVDDFSYHPSGVGKIVVRNEEELKDALIVLISLIKNWHERLIKLEEKHEEEILEIERRKND